MKKRIIVNSVERIDVINHADIIYIASSGRYSTFITADKRKITSSLNIGSYLAELPEDRFIRVHNSYVVNVDYIQYISKGENWYLTLSDGTRIPVSRRKKDELLEQL